MADLDRTHDDSGEMTRIVALLSETYTDEGVVIVLTGRNAHVSPSMPLVEFCRTAQGRAKVLDWATSLAEGNFS